MAPALPRTSRDATPAPREPHIAWPGRVPVRAAARALPPLLAAGVPFVLYVETLAPTVYNIDSAELATAAATWGIPHPPGYPLYALLAHAFVAIPVGDVGFRVNLLSALYAAAALLALYAIVVRLTSLPAAGVAAAWLLGLSYPFWTNAVVAEVYTLDAALLGGLLLFLLRWRDTSRTLDLVVACAFLGLSLANRTTGALSVPALALFVSPALRSNWRQIATAIPAAIPGVALNLLLPLRSASDSAYHWGSSYDLDGREVRIDLTDPHTLWWYVTAKIYRPLTEIYDWPDRLREARIFANDLWYAFLGGGVLLGALGLVWLLRRQPRVALLLLVVGVPQAAFFINYAVVDKQTMFLNVYFIVAVLAGCGVARLHDLLRSRLSARVVRAGSCAVIAGVALLLVWQNYPLADVSRDYRARDRAELLFARADDSAVVMGGWTDIAPLQYLQMAEGERDDLALVHAWALTPDYANAMVEYNLAQGRTVYLMRALPFLRSDFVLLPEEDWYRISAQEPAQEASRGS